MLLAFNASRPSVSAPGPVCRKTLQTSYASRCAVLRKSRQSFVLKSLSWDDLPCEDEEQVQEVMTFITNEGFVRFPGKVVKRVQRAQRNRPRLPTWEEQGLCIGASFLVAATNGHDPSRRVNYYGFCQSVDYLFESVEDAVVRNGGEILDEERSVKSGIHEMLRLTVAVPFLWGVPPQVDAVSLAIKTGGGIIEKQYLQWVIQPLA